MSALPPCNEMTQGTSFGKLDNFSLFTKDFKDIVTKFSVNKGLSVDGFISIGSSLFRIKFSS